MAAYGAAHYEADTPAGRIVLRIGEPSAALARLYGITGTRRAAYLTACNPASIRQPPARNRAAHAALLASLRPLGYPIFEGFGRDPQRRWPAERSVLVLGIAPEAACALGQAHGQAAIVTAALDAVPQLTWLI